MGKNGDIIPRDPRSGGSVPASINLKLPIDFKGEFGLGLQWTHEYHIAERREKQESCGLGFWKKMTLEKQGHQAQFATCYSSQTSSRLSSSKTHSKKQ